MDPTVGRMIEYWPGTQLRADDFAYIDASQPCAAIIAYVYDPTTVNLTVFDQHGKVFSEREVTLIPEVQGAELPKDKGYATWMPYQKGQAAKTEKLQAELDQKSKRLDRLAHAVDATPGGEKWRKGFDKET